MTALREAVARAMWEAEVGPISSESVVRTPPSLLRLADAAIAAVREALMARAFHSQPASPVPQLFRAMVDEALREGG